MQCYQHPECNDVLRPPKGATSEECRPLPILRDALDGTPVVMSFWRPSAEELMMLQNGGGVVLVVHGHTHPPLFLTTTGPA